jgi:protein-S-isoprenylcysteine O-methyltransferase Ste14
MITGVLAILIGEAIAFAARPLWTWAALFVAINHIYFLLSEEPGLAGRFGAEYDEYKRHVPRWIPRLTAWRPPGN